MEAAVFFVVISTGLAVIAAMASIWCAVRAQKAHDRTAEIVARMSKSVGAIHANRLSLDALDDRLRALNGRVNATLHRARRDEQPQQNLLREFDARTLVDDGGDGGDGDLDPDLAAELALQHAPPVAPGKGAK